MPYWLVPSCFKHFGLKFNGYCALPTKKHEITYLIWQMISNICLYMFAAINTYTKIVSEPATNHLAAKAGHIPYTKCARARTHAYRPPSTNQKANKSHIKPTQITDVGNAPCCYIHIPRTSIRGSTFRHCQISNWSLSEKRRPTWNLKA
jgi:hypothetical protein